VGHQVGRVHRGTPRNSRKIRRYVLIIFGLLGLGVAGAWRFSRPYSPVHSACEFPVQIRSASQDLSALAAPALPPAPAAESARIVYPYSIVPGGVHSPEELREAASHDQVVASHYAGFAYQKAKVVQVKQPKLVFLSYRIGDRIYWTNRRIALHVGEKLISDGKVTTRTRCANQVSESPHQPTSPAEPPASKLDEPVNNGDSGSIPYPGSSTSSLRLPHISTLVTVDPPPGSGFYPPSSSGGPPIVAFPPPSGGCAAVSSVSSQGDDNDNSAARKRNKPCSTTPTSPPSPPPVPVPEPGNIWLIALTIVGIYLWHRKYTKDRKLSSRG